MSIIKTHPALRRVRETNLTRKSVPVTFFKQEFKTKAKAKIKDGYKKKQGATQH